MVEMKVTLKKKKMMPGILDLTISLYNKTSIWSARWDHQYLHLCCHVPAIVFRSDLVTPTAPIVVRETNLHSSPVRKEETVRN